MKFFWAFFLLLPRLAAAQTTVTGDGWVAGKLAVGTTTISGRVDVAMAAASTTTFQVSGVDETPFLTVASSGAVGMGVAPAAALDISGTGDSGAVGAQLRNGNLYPASGSSQITFGYNGTTNLRHAIQSSHSSTTAANNSLDFILWSTVASTTSVGAARVLSLVTTSTAAFVHVSPVGEPFYEFVISNGVTTGGGVLHRALEGTHSSRALKQDIRYLEEADHRQAYEDVRGLKHVQFRYKINRGRGLARDGKQPLHRGLLFEEAPAGIRGLGATISVDDRLVNAEMAAQELLLRLSEASQRSESMK